VQRIIIHLDQRTPTVAYRMFGRRTVPVFNYFQAGLVLYADGVLTARQLLYVAREMLESREYELTSLANSLQDVIRRGRVSVDVARQLSVEVGEAAAQGALAGTELPPYDRIAALFADRVRQLGGAPPLQWSDELPVLDYPALVAEEQATRKARARERRRMRA
jgi:hypothetical protein